MSSKGYDYSITRTLDAPVGKVWNAWTKNDEYGKWAHAEEVELDVRPGGEWRSVMVIPGGARVPLTGTYTEVVPKERLVLGMNVPGSDEPALMAADFVAEGNKTKITLSQTFDTAEDRDQAEQGSNMLLDGLTAYLAEN
ncbi:SRPBCC family protein [Prauserella endophytica]|uniref:SRPBCC domain-containing protein n=1 Tax=Prauserella endophytica TaxID=1592324 RepID=A0ABY2RX31_9PSEU|nr:SRPBCC domain-containing protein [Prauserella endophytica]TKG63811.1 SRPBCC domain-containing protein [Prauserella endophytica]